MSTSSEDVDLGPSLLLCGFRLRIGVVGQPMSPLLDDSVKEGVPSVQVGVEPSTEAGGVQVRVRPVAVAPEPKPDVEELDSTLREDLLSGRDSNLMSDMLTVSDSRYAFTT